MKGRQRLANPKNAVNESWMYLEGPLNRRESVCEEGGNKREDGEGNEGK